MTTQQIKDLQAKAQKEGDTALVGTCKRALQGGKRDHDFLFGCTEYFTKHYPAA